MCGNSQIDPLQLDSLSLFPPLLSDTLPLFLAFQHSPRRSKRDFEDSGGKVDSLDPKSRLDSLIYDIFYLSFEPSSMSIYDSYIAPIKTARTSDLLVLISLRHRVFSYDVHINALKVWAFGDQNSWN